MTALQHYNHYLLASGMALNEVRLIMFLLIDSFNPGCEASDAI